MAPPVATALTLLQHASAPSFGPARVRAFALAQAARRCALLRAELGTSPPLLPQHEALQRALGSCAAALSSEELLASSQSLDREVLAYVGLHKDLVLTLRRRGDTSVGDRLRRALVRAQFLALTLRLLAATGAGASAPLGARAAAGVDLAALVRATTAGVLAFSVEKHGAAPGVDLSAAPPSAHGTRLVGVPESLAFVFAELLKNAVGAMVCRVSAGGLDDAPPVVVRVSADAHFVYLTVADAGCGLPPELVAGDAFPLFACESAATPARVEIDYKYSREFGVPFAGLGLGLVRADLFARLHGGRVLLREGGVGTGGGGTTAVASFERHGLARDALDEALGPAL